MKIKPEIKCLSFQIVLFSLVLLTFINSPASAVITRNNEESQLLACLSIFTETAVRESSGTVEELVSFPDQSASKVKASLYLLINKERRKAGLKALEKDRRLEEIATSHSRDMVNNNFTGHVSPTTGGPDQRLKSAGINFNHFGENVGRGYTSAGAIHSSFMESPGHKMIILDPEEKGDTLSCPRFCG